MHTALMSLLSFAHDIVALIYVYIFVTLDVAFWCPGIDFVRIFDRSSNWIEYR